MSKHLFILLLIGLLILVSENEAMAQCANCKAAIESGMGDDKLTAVGSTVGRGLNSGILYLALIPYALLMFMVWFFLGDKIKAKIKAYRSARV